MALEVQRMSSVSRHDGKRHRPGGSTGPSRVALADREHPSARDFRALGAEQTLRLPDNLLKGLDCRCKRLGLTRSLFEAMLASSRASISSVMLSLPADVLLLLCYSTPGDGQDRG